jgi:hypothetical protein
VQILDARLCRGILEKAGQVPHTPKEGEPILSALFLFGGELLSVVLSVEILSESSVHNFGDADALKV